MADPTKKPIRTPKLLFACALFSMYVSGCGVGGNDAEDCFQDADPKAPLTITYPQDGMVVEERRALVHGIGYREGMHLTVKTDTWYPQVDPIRHDKETGSWCGYVYLGGQGIYNNHTIRAVAPSGEADEVTGIVATGEWRY